MDSRAEKPEGCPTMMPPESPKDAVRVITRGPRYYATHFHGRKTLWRGEGYRNLDLARKDARDYHAMLPEGAWLDESPPRRGLHQGERADDR